MIPAALLEIDADAKPDTVKGIHLITQAVTGAHPHMYFSVAEIDGVTAAFLGGGLYTMVLEQRRYAQDILAYVLPQHRGTAAYYELAKEFQAWAFGVGADEVRGVLSNPENAEKIAGAGKRLGFIETGRLVVAKRPKEDN